MRSLEGKVAIVTGLGKGTIESTTEEEWDYMTLAKMKGAFNLMHFAVPIMKQQGFGRIIYCRIWQSCTYS